MLTIDLEPELETILENVAKQEHVSANEIVKRLVSNYIKQKQEAALLIDMVNHLPEIACFKDKDPLEIQKVLRDELRLEQKRETSLAEKISEAKKGHTAITQKFIGLLAGSNLDESDYKKHLEEKYL